MRISGPSQSSQVGRKSPTHQRVRCVVQSHLGAECSDVIYRIAAAIVRLEGQESEGGWERLALYLGSERGTAFGAFSSLPS
ncbi:hypothetical protein BHE74_00051889 [Ensete ventricosum]|uniref:Uncharacterized protein n=1 Tax=Ensete ventricosum TaxID=4639 RepID=A0A426XT39_ENSVE|nr:hypothetical protein B296_00043454 [Ensete ventricosum]RWW42559.1 hypothetical protein BHE74_00051889 [Ensete ventricosum]